MLSYPRTRSAYRSVGSRAGAYTPATGKSLPQGIRRSRQYPSVEARRTQLMRSSASCNRWAVVLILVSLASFIGSATASAQTATILGQVTDQSGAVLPGVTVTATSPALQVPEMTVVTNEEGEYRLAPLPIGVYPAGVRSRGLPAGPAPGCAAGRRLHRENRCGSWGWPPSPSRSPCPAASPVVDVSSTAAEHAADEGVPRAHAHDPQRDDEPVDPGARRAQLPRYRRQPARGELADRARSDRAARCGSRSTGLPTTRPD